MCWLPDLINVSKCVYTYQLKKWHLWNNYFIPSKLFLFNFNMCPFFELMHSIYSIQTKFSRSYGYLPRMILLECAKKRLGDDVVYFLRFYSGKITWLFFAIHDCMLKRKEYLKLEGILNVLSISKRCFESPTKKYKITIFDDCVEPMEK